MGYYDDWVDPGGTFRTPRPKGTVTVRTELYSCPLCERDDCIEMSKHHLVPKSRGGKGDVKLPICQDCHSTIHKFFDNRTLETTLNTVESLQEHPGFAKYLAWVRRRPGTRRYRPKRRKRET
jgi:hypothetical protein